MTNKCAQILQINDEKTKIELIEIQAGWVMEGGHILPEPGGETAWFEKHFSEKS